MRKLVVLLALLALPAPAGAQLEAPLPRARLGLTALTGVRVPYTTGVITGFDASGAQLFQLKEERSGSPALGGEAELHLAGPVSLIGAGLYTGGGERVFFASDTVFGQAPDVVVRSGSEVLFARVGLLARIAPERAASERRVLPSTDLFGGVALVRELDSNHPALSLGFRGALPVARSLEFTLGLENYLVFWDQDVLRSRMAAGFQELAAPQLSRVSDVDLFFDTSNILLLQAGISLRR